MEQAALAGIGLVLFWVYVAIVEFRAHRLATSLRQLEATVEAREQTIAVRDAELGRLYPELRAAKTANTVHVRELRALGVEVDSLREQLRDARSGVVRRTDAVPSTVSSRPGELEVRRALQPRATPISGRPVGVAS